MVEIHVEYLGELRTRAAHGPSQKAFITDAPKDNEGKGESFSPTDLVATALGSCMVTVMGIAARQRDVALEGARAHVVKHMVADPLRRVVKLEVHIDMPAGIAPDQRPALEKAAMTCPVFQSLHPSIEIPTEFSYPD